METRGRDAESERAHKKKKARPVQIQTPVWQALACFSWLRDIVVAETAPANAAVAELNCKVSFLSVFSSLLLVILVPPPSFIFSSLMTCSPQGTELSKFVRVGASSYVGIDASAATIATAQAAARGAKMASLSFCVADVFRETFAEKSEPQLASRRGSCDAAYAFHDMHLLMESEATANTFFSNVSFLLKVGGKTLRTFVALLTFLFFARKSGGIFAAFLHDGAALWYGLQKETPEAPAPDFVPRFKKALFSCAADRVISRMVGEKYRVKISGEKATQLHGFLINNTLLRTTAKAAGLELINLQNCGELFELFRATFAESLKKKATSSLLAPEQKEYVDVFQVAIFRKCADQK